MYPSLIDLGITGIIILLFMIIVGTKYIDGTIMKLTTYETLSLILFFGILIGIHGLQHASAEVNYKYNPLELIKL